MDFSQHTQGHYPHHRHEFAGGTPSKRALSSFTLNYLGYWWAEEGRNLEEAIALIERAVELRPESGYFLDSLGWVHFRLGAPEIAVQYLEMATALEPADPEIIGHLGDVYWELGRQQEARFKWRLALSFTNDPDEKKMLKIKIKNGYVGK